MPQVLLLLGNGFDEIEAIAVIDILRRASLSVVTLSLEASTQVTGSHGIVVTADAVCSDDPTAWLAADALVLPGGPGVAQLRHDQRVLAITKAFFAAGKLTAAICAAPLVLSDLGLLAEYRATSWPGVAAEIKAKHYSEERVIRDRHLITSRGAGTAVEFALALVDALVSPAAAAKIAIAIVA